MLEWRFMNKDESTTSALLPGSEPELDSTHVHGGRNYVVRCVLIDRPDSEHDLVIAEEV
jgi:hypothetical protein